MVSLAMSKTSSQHNGFRINCRNQSSKHNLRCTVINSKLSEKINI